MVNTGFPEIKIERLNYNGIIPWFIEVAITGSCNFNCKYCNRFCEDINLETLTKYFNFETLVKHIQITGGEPTIHKDFEEIIKLCRKNCNVLGLSTNGSYGIENYLDLPVDRFSISLDDYDVEILKQRGYLNPEEIIKTIKVLSRYKYVDVGLFVDDLNVKRIEKIIDFIISLGVDDIKISTSSRKNLIPKFYKLKSYKGFSILNYRVENFKINKSMRGITTDCNKCYLALNDVSVVGDKHYPCLVYYREHGNAIGNISNNNVYNERLQWFENHDCLKDEICKKYCMDFKCEYNNSKFLMLKGV